MSTLISNNISKLLFENLKKKLYGVAISFSTYTKKFPWIENKHPIMGMVIVKEIKFNPVCCLFIFVCCVSTQQNRKFFKTLLIQRNMGWKDRLPQLHATSTSLPAQWTKLQWYKWWLFRRYIYGWICSFPNSINHSIDNIPKV